jgi:hypothetical protein
MKIRLALCCSWLLVLFASVGSYAQATATLVGTVKDPSEAAIANAQVSVINAEKGINRTTVTNSEGEWAVAALPSGSYDLVVTAAGFKKFEAKGVVVQVAQKARVDVAMQVGAASTQVTVEGSAVTQVETQSSDLGGTISGKEISQLQLNGRNFTQLAGLVAGVSNHRVRMTQASALAAMFLSASTAAAPNTTTGNSTAATTWTTAAIPR